MADIDLIDVPLMDWPAAVTSITNTPPGGPSLNTCHIVGTSGTGAFSGHNNELARFNDSSAWEFKTPFTGQTVYNVGTSSYVKWNGSAWVASSTSSLQGAYDGGATIALVTGTDVDVANSSDVLLHVGSTAKLKSKDQATAGAAGNAVELLGGHGGAAAPAGTPGAGGTVTIKAGTKGSEAASAGATVGGVASNNVIIEGGSGGDSSGSKAGNVVIEGGQLGSGGFGGTSVPGDVKIGQDANKTHTVRIGQSSTGTPVEVKGPLWTPLITLTDAATVTVTLGKGNEFIVTLGGNRTLDFSFPNSFSNSVVNPAGIAGALIVKQDATGSRTLGFAAKVKTSGDVTLNSAANAYTVFRFDVEDASTVHLRKVEGGAGTITGVTAGTGLTGGGSSGSVTLNVAYGTSSGTALQGNQAAGGDTSGTLNNLTVTQARGLRETTGPTTLTMGAVVDGEFLKRSGTSIISAAAGVATTVKKAGTTIGTRGAINFIEGANVTITATDNSGADRVDVTVASSGGGGGALPTIWDTPASPNGDDEEFNSTTPPAGFELYNASDSVVITPSGSIDPYSAFTANDSAHLKTHTDWRRSYVAIQVSTESTTTKNYSYTKAVTVPTNRLIYARMGLSLRFTETAASAGNFGLMFCADSGGHATFNDTVNFYFEGNASTNQTLHTTKTVGGVFTRLVSGPTMNGGIGMPWDYLAIHKIGTTYHFWTFADSGQKHYWGSTTHSGTMARIGWFLRDGNSTNPGNTIFTADFIRCIDSATQLPC